MTNRTNEIKAQKQELLASIPTPDWRDVEQEGTESSDEEEDISNASYAIRHVIYELEERNRMFQGLAALEKGGGVTIIDIKGILADLAQKNMVIEHALYKEFVQMVRNHYSNLLQGELDTDTFLINVRNLLTDNAVVLKELVVKSDKEPVAQLPNFEVVDEEEVDESKTGRNYWDYFTTREEYESEYEDKDDEEFLLIDDSDAIIEIVASTDDDPNPEKRKRGRPRKPNQRPPPVLPINIKRRRGRPRKNLVVITTGNLEELAIENQPKPVKIPTESYGYADKRKRGRPKFDVSRFYDDDEEEDEEEDEFDEEFFDEYVPLTELPPSYEELTATSLPSTTITTTIATTDMVITPNPEFLEIPTDLSVKRKRGRPRKKPLVLPPEELPLTLSDSNISLLPDHDGSPILSDSLLDTTLQLELSPTDELLSTAFMETPKKLNKRGRTRRSKMPDHPLLEDHQYNSDIEDVSTSPHSIDSPVLSTITLRPLLNDEDDVSDFYDDPLFGDLNSENSNSIPSPIPSSPQQTAPAESPFTPKRARGRPRKKPTLPGEVLLGSETAGSDTPILTEGKRTRQPRKTLYFDDYDEEFFFFG